MKAKILSMDTPLPWQGLLLVSELLWLPGHDVPLKDQATE